MYKKKRKKTKTSSCSSSSLTSIFAHTSKTSPFYPEIWSQTSSQCPLTCTQFTQRGFKLLQIQRCGCSASFSCTDLHLQVNHEAVWWIHSGDLLPPILFLFHISAAERKEAKSFYDASIYTLIYSTLPITLTHTSMGLGCFFFPWHKKNPST